MVERARVGAQSAIRPLDLSLAVAPLAALPLATPIPYFGDEMVHPDVYFNAAGWNGYRYWMAATPYEGSNSQYENPSIYVSNDGQIWSTPPGATNPVVPYPGTGKYNSDPDLVDGLDGNLYLFYREVEMGVGDGIYFVTTSDGVAWSAPTFVLKPSVAVERPSSMGVLFDGKTWSMYYVDELTMTIRRRIASSAAGPWSEPTPVNITAAPPSTDYYHLDAISFGGRVILLIDCTVPASGGMGGNLYLAWSSDGLTFSRASAPVLAKGTVPDFNANIYRATFLPVDDGYDPKLAIWYSGFTATSASWSLASNHSPGP